MPTTYSPAEVAERLGFGEDYIKALVRRHEVPCLRGPRRTIRFTEDHVAAIVAHLEQPATPAATSLTTARSRRRAS